MSTHNICFHWEIRKISAFFGWKKRLICCYVFCQCAVLLCFIYICMNLQCRWTYLGSIYKKQLVSFDWQQAAKLINRLVVFQFQKFGYFAVMFIYFIVIDIIDIRSLSQIWFNLCRWINSDAKPTSSFQQIRLLEPGCWYKFTYWMPNSADPDQLASSEANWSGSTLFAKAGYIRVQQDQG